MSDVDAQRAARIEQARTLFHSVPADVLVRRIARLFDLVEDGPDRFHFPAARTPTRARLFGGQVIAQAMMAAARTVDPSRPIHSLHSYFLRGGTETLPLDFEVHRDMDGGSFSNRRVVVRQGDDVIFNLTASFQRRAEGLAHQRPMPDVLPPEDCLDFVSTAAANDDLSDEMLAQVAQPRPFEMRGVRPGPRDQASGHYQWFRLRGDIGDDPVLHRAFLAFASDMGLLSTCMIPHGMVWTTPGLISTSLDHAMWFHADVRVDEWFVYIMDSDWTGGERGINHGRIYTRDGRLVATAAQEGLLRYRPPAEHVAD